MSCFGMRWCCLSLLAAMVLGGCGDPESATETVEGPPVMRADPSDAPPMLTIRELRRQLRANERAKFKRVGNDIVEAELFQSGVSDISALKGLPLRFLDLGMTEVSDLSALAGMPLKRLILENTKVTDLSVLKGMSLETLQLQNTNVTDLSVLKGMPLEELNLLSLPVDNLQPFADLPLKTLWLNQTQVSDLSPLKGKALVSLDVEGTPVADIEALAGMTTLKRLNISDTPITDVSPLRGLELERITLTPQTITAGMQVLRAMPSLRQIQTSMEGNSNQSTLQFWEKFDAGVWQTKPAADESKNAAPADDSASDKSPSNGAAPPAAAAADKSAADQPSPEKSSPDKSPSDERNSDDVTPDSGETSKPPETDKKDTQIPASDTSSTPEAAGK